jgi:hypothetical protein
LTIFFEIKKQPSTLEEAKKMVLAAKDDIGEQRCQGKDAVCFVGTNCTGKVLGLVVVTNQGSYNLDEGGEILHLLAFDYFGISLRLLLII